MHKKINSSQIQGEKIPEAESALLETLNSNYSASEAAFSTWKQTLDEKERFLYGKPRQVGQDESGHKANVNDPRLFTQVFERSIRVMSQLANGKFKGVSSDDIGKNLLMNLIVDRYVIPNANSQFNFLTKLRMINWYSLGYGSMAAIVDWTVNSNYAGPDIFMVPIRNLYPQAGVSFADMDWCQIKSEVSKKFIESRRGMEGWKNIDEFLAKTKSSIGKSSADKSADEMSLNDKIYSTSASNTKKFPRFELCTEYRRDRWITYSKEYQLILRDIPNPHGNNKLPIVVKYCIPMIDFVFGISEVEISSSLAEVVNSLYNLAIDDAKMQLYPPLIIDPGSVVLSSIRMGAAQKWLLNDKNSKEPSAFQTIGRGATSALEMRQMAVGSLQSLAGTSDTSVKTGEEYSMGKTPQALRMQEARQSARDEIDRFYMEAFITDVYGRFANLIVKKMTKKIILRLFKSEINKIAQTYPDVMQLVNKSKYEILKDNEKLDVKIPSDFFNGYQFDYEITPGSTYKIDQQTQAQNLQFVLEMAQNPSIQEALSKAGKRLDTPEIISRLLTNSGIADTDKILVDELAAPTDNPEKIQQQPQQNPFSQVGLEQQQVPSQQIPTTYQQYPSQMGRNPQIADLEAQINQRFQTGGF